MFANPCGNIVSRELVFQDEVSDAVDDTTALVTIGLDNEVATDEDTTTAGGRQPETEETGGRRLDMEGSELI